MAGVFEQKIFTAKGAKEKTLSSPRAEEEQGFICSAGLTAEQRVLTAYRRYRRDNLHHPARDEAIRITAVHPAV